MAIASRDARDGGIRSGDVGAADGGAARGTRRFDPVFAVSLAFVAAIGVWGLIDPDAMSGALLGFTNYLLTNASWYWLLICTGFLVLAGYMAFGPYGKVRLGRDDEEPEFSTASWIAMLFAGGMGAGLLFWGVAEPIYHYESPPAMAGGTPEAARMAMVITNLHWGLHAWSIYGVCALVIAYFTFRRGQDSMISTPIRPLFRGRAERPAAMVADTLAVLAVVFGLAGSLASGVLQVRAGLGEVMGAPADQTTNFAVLGVLFVAYMLSATTGVDKGIKILSNINMLIAIGLMLLVLFAGPTTFLLETFVTSLGDYVASLPAMAFRLFPFDQLGSWTAGWTLTYFIWWLAWAPFVGIFVARISRGRTIREFCLGVILIPSLFSVLWFAVFGGAGLYVETIGGGGLAQVVLEDVTRALFVFLDRFPFGEALGLTAALLTFIFLVTSADSGTFVLAMMTTNGNLNPPLGHKMVWGTLVAVLTAGVLLSDSIPVAKATAISGALPFSVILLLQVVGFLREVRRELPPAIRPIEARGEAVGARRP